MDRVKTDIPGFDSLVEGGIPKGSNLLLIGAPGTGKTIFGLQYLYNGALAGDNGLYITLDDRESDIKEQAALFGWDIKTLMDQKKLNFLELPLNTKMRVNLFKMVEDAITELNIQRIVFDSVSSFVFNINQFIFEPSKVNDITAYPEEKRKYLGEDNLYRQDIQSQTLEKMRPDLNTHTNKSIKRVIYLLLRELTFFNTTNMIITGESHQYKGASMDGVSEYISDGVITFNNELIGTKHVRTLSIPKMRKTSQSPYVHDLELSKTGLAVKPVEAVYQ